MSGSPVRLGTFLLTEPIGEGGMGTVWRARHPERVDVAVKVLRPDYGGTLLEAFRAEVRSVASLDHPHVVRVYDYGVVPEATALASGGAIPRGSPWLAMEFGDSGTLGDRSTLPDFGELVFLASELLEGLAHAHARGLVHRDLKPRNVLLFATPGHPRAALTDFGIAHLLGKADANAAQAGTPGYMAPEQIRGDRRALGGWTDLYALGCVLFRMATGRPPYAGPTKYHVLKAHLTADLPRLNPTYALPDGFEDFWRRLMAREPQDRFRTAADAQVALRTIVGNTFVNPDWRPRFAPTKGRPRGTGLGIFLLRPWPLTGRARQQEAAWDQLLRTRGKRAGAQLVFRGERGMGRTRMAQWLTQRAEETGAAECWWFPTGVSVRARLRVLLRVDGLAPGDRQVWLERWMAARGSPNPAVEARAVGTLLDATGPASFGPLIRRLAHDRVAVLVFDDLDRGDPDAWALFTEVGRLSAPALALATVAVDADVPPALREALEGAVTVPLEPLTEEEQQELIAFAGLTPDLAAQVVQRTAGTPWFLVSTVTEWARAGGLVPTSHGYDLRPGFEPALSDEVVQHGLRQVNAVCVQVPGAEGALELLALLGGVAVREDEWRLVCQRAGAAWQPARLATLGLVGSARAGKALRYTLTQSWLGEALLQRATRSGRRPALHLACAECLLQIPRSGARERAIAHLAAAGAVERAIEGLRALVDEAFHHQRLDRVRDFLAREGALLQAEGVGGEDPRRLLHELDALRLAVAEGGRAAAGSVVERGIASALPAVRWRAQAVGLQLVGAAADEARWAQCRRAAEVAGDARGWRQLVAWRVRWRSTHGDVAGALRDARGAREEAEASGDDLDRDRFEALELSILILHRSPEALPALQAARVRSAAAGRPDRAANWLAWTSALLRSRGDLAGAAAAAEQAQQELVAQHASASAAMVQAGFVALAQRAYGEAGGWFGRVLAEDRLPTDVAQLARAGLLVATADGEQWDLWDRTLEELTVALPETNDPGAFPTLDPDMASSLDLGALTALHRGEVARAREVLRVALRHHLARRDEAAAARTRQRIGAISQG
jgi:hypothetical protein